MGESQPPTAADWASHEARSVKQRLDNKRFSAQRMTYTANGHTYTPEQMLHQAKAQVLQGDTHGACTVLIGICEMLIKEMRS